MIISSRAYLILLFCILLFSLSQTMYSQGILTDSTASDTVQTTKPDSLTPNKTNPIPLVGSINRSINARNIITDSSINFASYRYPGDLLEQTPGVFVREFGTPGQLNDFTIVGLDVRNISVMSDGIRLNDPLTGMFNLFLYPTEQIDHVEVIQGTRAFLYGLNSTGGVINFVTKSKKALHPYSHLRYTESAFGFGSVDGMVSQDVLRGLNVTAGFQHTTFGPRFVNDDYDGWNARVKLRYNISNSVNVVASEMYNQTQLGLNGGIEIPSVPELLWFDRIRAVVRNSDAYEKITRHDAQVGAAAHFLGDSNAVTTLTLYLSSNLREYRDEENRSNPNGTFIQQDHRSQWMGITLSHYQEFGQHTLDLGATIELQRALVTGETEERRATLSSVFGKLEIRPSEILTLSPYARFERLETEEQLSYGGDAVLAPTSYLELFGGYSRSNRFPTLLERDGVFLFPIFSDPIGGSPEHHDLFETGLRFTDGTGLFEIKFCHRTIADAILLDWGMSIGPSIPFRFVRDKERIINGASAKVSGHIGSLFVEGNAQYLDQRDDNAELRFRKYALDSLDFPRWAATGGVYFWDKLFNGHLNLKAGVRGRVFSSYLGREYSPQIQIYLPLGLSYAIPTSGTIDLVIIAHLGDAYVHFIWDNLLNRKYVMTSFYPMPERQVRFGVSWEFTN